MALNSLRNATTLTLIVLSVLVGGCTTTKWQLTGSMAVPRFQHTATLLRGGSVLVTGGTDSTNVWDSAELYDEATGTWSAAPPMHFRRVSHTATRLLDGRVLVAGGIEEIGEPPTPLLSSAEIYDPVTNRWTVVAPMHTPRAYHLAERLLDGRVLVVSGGPTGKVETQRSAELYDPATDTWTIVPNTGSTHTRGTITRLTDGSILVAGGFESDTDAEDPPIFFTNYSERYVPDGGTGRWREFSVMHETPAGHGASLLDDGSVLVTAGMTAGGTVRTTVRYRPSSTLANYQNSVWQYSKDTFSVRSRHTQTTLSDGTVMVVGGYLGCLAQPPFTSCAISTIGVEQFQSNGPVLGVWTKIDNLNVPRGGHTATSLALSCKLLVVGGYDWAQKVALSSAEFYSTPCITLGTDVRPIGP